MKVRRFASRELLDAALAEQLKHAFETEDAAVMLSGGHTPRAAYRLLANRKALHPAPGLRVLYCDERHVPPTSQARNYHASLPLLRALALPQERVCRVRTELPLDAAALDYERSLHDFVRDGGRISLGLLGMGPDGHTAALFTCEDLERARGRFAIAVQRPDGMQAVSVTPELLSRVETLLMVVVGNEKRDALVAFLARHPQSIAWRAVAHCPDVQTWTDLPP